MMDYKDVVHTAVGDSGGPVYYSRGLEFVGLVSRGDFYFWPSQTPGIYTNVANYCRWIKVIADVTCY